MGFSGLGRGMWGGLWLLSVSWRTPGAGPGGGGSFLGRWPSAWCLHLWGKGVPTEALASIVLKHNASVPTAASVSQACACCVCVGTCAEEDGVWSGLTPDGSVTAETLPASLVPLWSGGRAPRAGLTWAPRVT
ncbi:hypothetical protein HJG60_009382 [Phyllostomus discolor]|uniref:Secreted protein n=1 Tax=Phyllostomus discolor TaxID=89673 RepID=A0A833YJ04_9CHIR|nr:hypothetical protein HJG60_009382 [Phyllostomus discolor]